MKDEHRQSPEQLFSQTIVHTNLKHKKVFGCPAYVLDESLQQGSIFHKWKERARVGMYLGKSPNHAMNVSLVMNIRNGLVSPQFHVQHDNRFDTVSQNRYESTWQIKAGFVNVVSKRKMEKEMEKGQLPKSKKRSINQTQVEYQQMKLQRKNHDEMVKEQTISRDERQMQREKRQRLVNAANSEGDGIPTSEGAQTIAEDNNAVEQNTMAQNKDDMVGNDSTNVLSSIIGYDQENELFCFESICASVEQYDEDPIIANKAVADPDVMYLHQAMKEKDKDKFIEAMRKEVSDQKENGNFIIMERNKVPKDKTILKSVWQMRRKRDIKTREIKKYKARFNIDGSRMRYGVDYDDTYAPVAKWSTIRMILSLASVHDWHTRQLDYVLAFPQAPVERELYMEVPRGFEIQGGDSKDYLLKIQRNIYGQKQAGRVWNKYLVDKLTKELGFKQSAVDECLFYRGKVLYALYTDDSILAGPEKYQIDKIIKEMKEVKLNITDEGNVEDFLGVNIEKQEDGSIKLTQPHLIDQIMVDLKMTDNKVKIKDTPAQSSNILRRFDTSKSFYGSFHYRSVIG